MRRTVLLLVLALTLPLAGCLAGDDGGGNVGTATTDDGTNTTPDPAASTTGPDANRTHTWNETTIEGSVTGGHAPVVVSWRESGGVETWNVTGTVPLMHVNISAGGELSFYIYPPGCESSGAFAGADCASSNTTGNGEYTHTVENATEGEWRIEFFRQDPGYGTTDYTLTIAQLVEV